MIELDQLLILYVLFNFLECGPFVILNGEHFLENDLKFLTYVRVRELDEVLGLLEVLQGLDELIFGART